jgi:tellurite methyltransferase
MEDPSASRHRWDHKHRNAGEADSPAPFLLEVAGAIPKGRCLDLAAGRGGNALFMARRGYLVDGVDWSFEGLAALRSRVSGSDLQLNLVAADLTSFPLPEERYNVLICFRYLQRDLWPAMARALKPGGALVMETFTVERVKSRPNFPAEYCLEPGELRAAFPELRVEIYREEPGHETASILAFRPLRR